MTYRDDRDADQARIKALETDLEAANRKIAELEGKRTTAIALATSGALATSSTKPPFFGVMSLQHVASFEGEYPRDDLETLVEQIRAITGDHGRTELFKSSLTWTSSASERSAGPFISISVAIKDGRTTLTVSEKLTKLAGAIYGGIGGGVGGGGIMAPIALAYLGMPVLIPAALVAWFGGVLLGSRAIYKSAVRRRTRKLQDVFDRLNEVVATKLVRPG